MAQEGWLCPQCRRVNAPWMAQCTCRTANLTLSGSGQQLCPTCQRAQTWPCESTGCYWIRLAPSEPGTLRL